jgi:hypothetical protein
MVKAFNDPRSRIQVFLISKAGGEGLDLKGVRDVILFESSWNAATEEQVIARAVRLKSHTHLEKEDQKVDVWRLLLVKPEDAAENDELPSVDEYLYDLSLRKAKKIKQYLKIIRNAAIENGNC